MARERDIFYGRLQDDYRLNGTASVIYRYLQEEQERQKTAGSRGSFAVRLRARHEALLSGLEGPEDYIKYLLEGLYSNRALYEADIDRLDSQPTELLSRLIEAALGKDSSRRKSKSRVRERLGELAELLNKNDPTVLKRLVGSGYMAQPFERLSELTDVILENAVHREVKAFFYDAGYPYREDVNAPQAAKGRNKEDKTLRLLEAYCHINHITLFGEREEGLSEEECQALLEAYRKQRKDSVIHPLRVDVKTGCSLLIVGKTHFRKSYRNDMEAYRRIKQSCAFGITRLEMGGSDGLSYTLDQYFDQYPSIDEAMEEYREECHFALADMEDANGSPLITAADIHEMKRELENDFAIHEMEQER